MGRLVLTRRVGETTHIGPDVSMTIVSYDRGQVKIAFDAPEAVRIYRAEIYERIKREQENGTNPEGLPISELSNRTLHLPVKP